MFVVSLFVLSLRVYLQSQADTASGDDGDGHMDVTFEGSGSSVPSEDEDTYINTMEFSLPLASPSALALARDSVDTQKLQSDADSQSTSQCVVEAAPEKPSTQHGLDDDECYVGGDGGHVMESSELEASSLPNLRDSTGTEDVQASPELAINSVEANPSKEQSPDVTCMSSKSKVNHEPKKKVERSPCQPLPERSLFQSQSCVDANISRAVPSYFVSHN